MNVVLTTPIRYFTGETIKDGDSDLLLRSVLISALTRGGDQADTHTRKASQFALGVKIATSGDVVDLVSGEVEMLKDLISKLFSVLVVGQVGKILDGQPTGIVPKVGSD